MANVEVDVNYQTLATNASTIRSHAQELNRYIKSAYSRLADMHNGVWYGLRYETLVDEFNAIILQVNDLLNLVVKDIPFSLETIANNYSQSDAGYNITTAQQTAPEKVSELGPYPEGKQNKMKYISADVEVVKKEIISDLDNAKSKMDTIKSVYDQTPWTGGAADAYNSTLTRLKNEINTSFENIKTQFTNIMNQAQADMNAAETGNTVG